MAHSPGVPVLDNTRPGWWRSAVVYQVYPRSFADSDGDGIGDLPGLLGKLDYLRELGVDVVWVSPFYPSPMVDNGYDISDYQSVEPLFGTLHDVDLLIEGLHSRGMKLMIDLVLNHTSEEHPWFIESRSSTDNDKRDWYWWRPAREGHEPGTPGAEPTNWMGFFSESAWQHDPATDEYYLHIFTHQQPDLNWENPRVREELYRMLRWWLDRGVDGFRMDVVNLVSKETSLPDGQPIPGTRFGDGKPYFVCGPRIHEFMAEFNAEVVAGATKVLMTVGETPGATTDDARRFCDPENAELDMVFQFEHMQVDRGEGGRHDPLPMDWPRMKEVLGRWQRELADAGWNSLYWNNHDQPRAVSRYGDDGEIYRELSAKTLGTVLHCQRGTPFVYQGEELGMTNYPFTAIDQYDDVQSRNWFAHAQELGIDEQTRLAALAARSRDHARTPMQWDDSPNAGFSTGTPWLPVNPNYLDINAQLQTEDPHSVFAHYQALIRLRHTYPVLVEGDFTLLLPEHPTVFAYTRRLEDGDGRHELLVAANCGTEDILPGRLAEEPEFDRWQDAALLLGNYADGSGGRTPDSLRPWESRVYYRSS
ncbi:MAG: glucohydrolase [Micrococcales bacterium]|nr:MAG: glucohydrolase [Micrococcales bacterium]PIE27118.1 MAG: glucohydrolase [Micrococcales bacterium]